MALLRRAALAAAAGAGEARAAQSTARPASSTRASARAARLLLAFPPESDGGVGVKYALPFQFNAGHLAMAPAPGGKTVVAGSTRDRAACLANGKPDRELRQRRRRHRRRGRPG